MIIVRRARERPDFNSSHVVHSGIIQQRNRAVSCAIKDQQRRILVVIPAPQGAIQLGITLCGAYRIRARRQADIYIDKHDGIRRRTVSKNTIENCRDHVPAEHQHVVWISGLVVELITRTLVHIYERKRGPVGLVAGVAKRISGHLVAECRTRITYEAGSKTRETNLYGDSSRYCGYDEGRQPTENSRLHLAPSPMTSY